MRDPAKQDPAFQLAAVPAFHDIAGAERKGRETGREERKKGDGMEEDGKLFVEQIKTKTARSRAAIELLSWSVPPIIIQLLR